LFTSKADLVFVLTELLDSTAHLFTIKNVAIEFRTGYRQHLLDFAVTCPSVTLSCIAILLKKNSKESRVEPVFIEPMQVVPVRELPEDREMDLRGKARRLLLLSSKAEQWRCSLVAPREWVYRSLLRKIPSLKEQRVS
jgi:hypothetical protein